MLGEDRWHEVTPSSHEHEAQGLALLREMLPDAAPYHAWTNFEFKDSQGRWHEVDAAVLGPGALHLVELKYYSGELSGNDTQWFRPRRRVEDSPLLLARRKAQRFKSKLQEGFRAWVAEGQGVDLSQERWAVPYVREAVFLHHPDLHSHLQGSAALGIFGLPGHERQMNLPAITDRLFEGPRNPRYEIGDNSAWALTEVMTRIGLGAKREPTAGSWSLIGALADGEDWQDWEASHQLVQDRRARIRFHFAPEGASEQARLAAMKVAENEFRVLQPLQHDGLLRPDEVVDSELGRGLVYPWDPKAERLDLWLARRGEPLTMAERLTVVRQLAEALHYAHRNRVVHRGLSPQALWIAERDGAPHVRIGEWQGAGRTATETRAPSGVTALQPQPFEENAAYQAPEGVWSPTANRIRLDLFGLGATAYFVLTGKAPATGQNALRERLRDQQGLDISVDLPQASSALRTAILQATRPRASERTSDVGEFLASISDAERILTTPETDHAADPLEANPGDLLDARFRVVRRLGAGSTAVGLLVEDAAAKNARRVLKVARDDTAAGRLVEEADVLGSLRGNRRIVQLHDRIVVGDRQCLLLSFAGPQTLADRLADGQRLSLDFLQRWGEDLFEALEVLDRAGIDHRDIKPANLGVLEASDGRQHLVLFDFSLSRAATTSISAGTVPYLDPFLGGARATYDRAAERYAAAVVLFEMATGGTPVYGDPDTHPDAVDDEATIEPAQFDQSVAEELTEFFRTALARDAEQRHETIGEMRRAWGHALVPSTSTTTTDGDDRAAKATLKTALTGSGLTPRALSMLERFAVNTVGELLAVDPVRLNATRGVAWATKQEVTERHKQWRRRLGAVATARPREDALLPSIQQMGDLFTKAVGARSKNRARVLTATLGRDAAVDPLAPQTVMAKKLELSAQRIGQLLNDIQDRLGADPAARELIRSLDALVRNRVAELGGVASVEELVESLQAATPTSEDSGPRPVQGLIRLLIDRHRLLASPDRDRAADDEVLIWRRNDGTFVLAAQEANLLDVAEAVGARAEQLVAGIDGGAEVIPAGRVEAEMAPVLARFEANDTGLTATSRLSSLGASLNSGLAASSQGELHSRELAPAHALALAVENVGPNQTFQPKELIDRVAARFPDLSRIAAGEVRDVVAASGLDLVWSDDRRIFAPRQLTEAATATDSRLPTALPVHDAPLSAVGPVGQRLLDSRRSSSFLILGVPGDQLDRLTAVVTSTPFDARELNVTQRFLHHLREINDALTKPVPWSAVRLADAQPAASTGGRGLRKLAEQAITKVVDDIGAMLADEAGNPVVLTDASPLARYGQAGALTRWSDLSRPREQALWLVLPQLVGHQGALLEGVPVQSSPNQFVTVDRAWIGAQWTQINQEKVGA